MDTVTNPMPILSSNESKERMIPSSQVSIAQSTNVPGEARKEISSKPLRKKSLLILAVIFLIIIITGLTMFFTSGIWIYRNWWTYKDNNYGFEVKFPKEFVESIGNEGQIGLKQFNLKGNPFGKNGPVISIIITPTLPGMMEEYQKLLTVKNNEFVTFREVNSIKKRFVKLDGCFSPQYYTHQKEYNYSPRYDTTCTGNVFTIDIRVSAGTKEIVDDYYSIYQKILKSFRFNNLKLSDSGFVYTSPTPTDMPEWITYKNNSYNFELRQKSDWTVYTDFTFKNYDHYVQEGIIYISPFEKSAVFDGNTAFIIIISKPISEQETITEYVERFKKQEVGFYPLATDYTVEEWKGMAVVKETGTLTQNENQITETKMTLYYLKYITSDNYSRIITVGYNIPEDQKNDYQEVLEKMLSSFKFVE